MSERDPGRELAYAPFRSNIDWKKASRECGDPDCDGDCKYIADVRRLVGEIDGGILPEYEPGEPPSDNYEQGWRAGYARALRDVESDLVARRR